MAFNVEKVFVKQCLSGRLNTDCHLSFNRNVKGISGPPTLVEMREWKSNEAETETCNETEPETGLCEVFFTYTFKPKDLQTWFVNGVLQRIVFYFWFFILFFLCFSPFPYPTAMQSNASILMTSLTITPTNALVYHLLI